MKHGNENAFMSNFLYENTSTTVYKKGQAIFYENDGQPQNLRMKTFIPLSILINFCLITKSKVTCGISPENELLGAKPVILTFNLGNL